VAASVRSQVERVDIARRAGTYLYGRRMYETLAVWETDASLTSRPGVTGDFAAIWQAADKIVYSTTLAEPVPTRRTTVEHTFDPDAVRALKASTGHDLMIGGGKPALPDGVRVDLELAGHGRFANGTAYLHYRLQHL
jgi:hypothetical protein